MRSSKEYYQDALNRADGSLKKAVKILEDDVAFIRQEMMKYHHWSPSRSHSRREAGKMQTAIQRLKAQLAKAKTKS